MAPAHAKVGGPGWQSGWHIQAAGISGWSAHTSNRQCHQEGFACWGELHAAPPSALPTMTNHHVWTQGLAAVWPGNQIQGHPLFHQWEQSESKCTIMEQFSGLCWAWSTTPWRLVGHAVLCMSCWPRYVPTAPPITVSSPWHLGVITGPKRVHLGVPALAAMTMAHTLGLSGSHSGTGPGWALGQGLWFHRLLVQGDFLSGSLVTYVVAAMSGKPINGTFYRLELQKVMLLDYFDWRHSGHLVLQG